MIYTDMCHMMDAVKVVINVGMNVRCCKASLWVK